MARLTIDDLEVLTPDQLGKLLLAEVSRNRKSLQYIQDILDVGCPINYGDHNGWTPLHFAAHYGNLRMAEFLISKGADIHARDEFGWTPLHWGTRAGHLEIVKFLVSVGSDVYTKVNTGRIASDIAFRGGHQEVAHFLFSIMNPNNIEDDYPKIH